MASQRFFISYICKKRHVMNKGEMNLGGLVITFLGVNFDFFFMLLFLLKKYWIS